MILFSSISRADQKVTILLQTGDSVNFAFTNRPAILFGDSIKLNSDSITVVYNYKEIKRIYVNEEMETPTLISDIKGKKSSISFRIINDGLCVDGLSNKERVTLYSIDGKMLKSAMPATDSKHVLLRLDGLGVNNIFIVHTSTGVSFKFIYK